MEFYISDEEEEAGDRWGLGSGGGCLEGGWAVDVWGWLSIN